MSINTSYRQILSISAPIMLASAAQNVITLSDGVFLYHLGEGDFATIGFVGVYYMIMAVIGYGISKGGQIMIARRVGERNYIEVGKTFYSMLYFELFLSVLLFFFLRYGSSHLLDLFVDSKVIYQKSLEYLSFRSFGIFFSFTGVAIIALYTGIARTKFLMWDTLILAAVNITLDYGLVFGHFGLPQMGIAGAGLASTIAEVVAVVVFIIYLAFDKKVRKFALSRIPKWDWELTGRQVRLAAPIVVQYFIGMASWFTFFGIVENLGERQLAISNLVRMVYMILAIPTMGFASGLNTLVSQFIGLRKRAAVIPITWKASYLNMAFTLGVALPVVLFPKKILYPLFGGTDTSLLVEARPVLLVLFVILMVFSIGAVFFNGLSGTGATLFGMVIQIFVVALYLVYIYFVINYTNGGLTWAWASEILYWGLMFIVSYYYLKSKRWYAKKV